METRLRLPGISALLLAAAMGCSSAGSPPAPPPVPSLKKIEDPKSIPGLAEKAHAMIGHDYFLDTLPERAQTLDGGFQYLVTETKADLIRDAMRGWKETYGAEVVVEWEGRKVTVFLYSNAADFTGGLVYSVSEPGDIGGRCT
jgi:hypothetical protein